MEGLVVDNFAGGGGASCGIVEALGRPVDLAVNHSAAAVAVHEANHPETDHACQDVWTIDPREAARGRSVAVAWFSPDCTHFSRAKGGAPRSKGVRDLAHVVIRWAREVRPMVIFLENVEEFTTWGPLDDEGQPVKARAGEDFRAWVAALRDLGYSVEWRSLVAADYGAPTTRRRLFLVARADGQRIRWPEPTHGRGRARPWRTAAEVIDWDVPCPSIFDRKRPLADATLRRIAAGLRRYVFESARPFIVPVTHTKSGDRVHSVDAPLRTVTTAKGGELALVAPTLVQTGYGEREGQRPRALDIGRPLGTVVSGGKHALAAAFLTRHYGGIFRQDVDAPMATVTAREHFTASSVRLRPAQAPLSFGEVDRTDSVRAFLVKYYGSDGSPTSQQQSLFDPMHTVTTKARFGLVTVAGEDYAIADIGLRMLLPRELFRANDFPEGYVIDPEPGRWIAKRLTKTEQIELAGNAVCRANARALVAANLYERPEALTGAA